MGGKAHRSRKLNWEKRRKKDHANFETGKGGEKVRGDSLLIEKIWMKHEREEA